MDWVKKFMEYRVQGRRSVGRPRRTWLESVEEDMEKECYEEKVHPHRKTKYPTHVFESRKDIRS